MPTRLSKNLEQAMIDKQSSREQLDELSGHSFITYDRIAIKSKLQASFIIDQQNAKQLQQIQKKALLLKQKQKKQRTYLKRLKKLFQQQQKEFIELKNVSKIALDQKSREIQLLAIELEELKEEKYQFLVLRDEKDILVMKNQQLEEENKTLGKDLAVLEEKYRGLKVQFQQQAELLDKGIRQNEIQIQTQPSTASTHGNNQPTSLKQVQLLSRQLQQKLKKQLQQQELKKQQTNLKIQTDKMNNCNFMLESLLKQIKKQQRQRQSESTQIQTKIQRSELKLVTLTDELMKKTHELSEAFGDLHRVDKQMRQKQRFLEEKDSIIQDLSQQIKHHQSNLDTKLQQMQNYKRQIQIYHDLEKMRDEQEKQVRMKRSKNYEKFQQQIQKLFQDKLLKEHSSVYEVFENITKEIFSSYNTYQVSTSSLSSDGTSQKFIENVLKLIQKNLLKLNDYFRLKAQKQVERIHKMVGMMKNANDIIHKNEDQYEKERENDMFNVSSPQRFNYMGMGNENIGIMGSASHHQRQESESSAQSKKKSIVLEEDLDSALNLEQELDSIKEQALQKEFADLKASQVVMIDSLNDPTGSQQSRTITDVKSQSSFSKSKVSQLSSAQQQAHYNKNIQQAKIHAKLKAKKKKK